jgi:hypothetical protein
MQLAISIDLMIRRANAADTITVSPILASWLSIGKAVMLFTGREGAVK